MNLPATDYPIPQDETWEVVDSSKLQTYMKCPRKYFFEYVLGWRLDRPNNHLHFGEAVHKALEHLYRGPWNADTVYAAYEIFEDFYRQSFPPDTDELFWPKTPDNVMEMLILYVNTYRKDLKNFEVLQLETSGAVPINDSDDLIYLRMDSIMRDTRDGQIFSLEHKTASSTWKWESQWDLKVQAGTYTHALYCLYPPEDVKGVMMNGLFFKKNKTNTLDLMRYPVWKNNLQMQAWLDNVNTWIARMKHDFQLLAEESVGLPTMAAFPQCGESCGDYGGCPYHTYCISWPNPLQYYDRPPMEMTISFWDPRQFETTDKIVLKGEQNG